MLYWHSSLNSSSFRSYFHMCKTFLVEFVCGWYHATQTCVTRAYLQFISRTSTPIVNMVRDEFVGKNLGKKLCMSGPTQILRRSRDIKVFPKKKLNFQKKKSLSIGKFQSEISPELCRIERGMPETLF